MTDFVIEKNIPIPVLNQGQSKGYSEVLRKLQVGDSVVLPIPRTSLSLAGSILGSGNFAARKCDGGYRVWRLK